MDIWFYFKYFLNHCTGGSSLHAISVNNCTHIASDIPQTIHTQSIQFIKSRRDKHNWETALQLQEIVCDLFAATRISDFAIIPNRRRQKSKVLHLAAGRLLLTKVKAKDDHCVGFQNPPVSFWRQNPAKQWVKMKNTSKRVMIYIWLEFQSMHSCLQFLLPNSTFKKSRCRKRHWNVKLTLTDPRPSVTWIFGCKLLFCVGKHIICSCVISLVSLASTMT